MALTPIHKRVRAVIAANRSETSYMAGGAVLNEDWFRLSDDLDIFHDTDEEIVASARKDIAAFESAGLTGERRCLRLQCGGPLSIQGWRSQSAS